MYGNKPRPGTVAYERMRFNSMTQKQLWTRLGKMTNPDKLRYFAVVAKDKGYYDLAGASYCRLHHLTGEAVPDVIIKTAFNKTKSQRLLRRLDIPK